MFIGTVYYYAPEMVTKTGFNEKSDIWSLGCVFYELITGHPPFLGNNRD